MTTVSKAYVACQDAVGGMFTVSCYALHPLVQRYVTLWRYVQLLTDCLTFALSMLCCQCWSLMPRSTTSSRASVEEYQIMPHPLVESGRASGEPFRPQHLVIDFQPQPGDNEETGLKCSQFWDAVHKHPDLEGMVVLPESDKKLMKQSSHVPVHRNSAAPNNYSNCPALDIFQNLEEKGGVLNAAFATNSSKAKCHK